MLNRQGAESAKEEQVCNPFLENPPPGGFVLLTAFEDPERWREVYCTHTLGRASARLNIIADL
jgi:hypothetical protein